MSDFANKLKAMYRKVVDVKGGCGGARAGGARRRKVVVKRRGGELLGEGVSGGRRKVRKAGVKRGVKKAATNPWIKHCKAYAKAHGCSYGVAMKKARASYRG